MQEKERLYTRKSQAAIGWKKTNGKASLVHNLWAVQELFVDSELGWKFWWKCLQEQIGGKESALGQEQKIYCHHNVERRQDFVKDEVQWLNQKQETGC